MSSIARFMIWAKTAPADMRVEATSALARAYLECDLAASDRLLAETAMMALLDDPSPAVRCALADRLADWADAPRNVVLALAQDDSEAAEIVLGRSPQFIDAELVDAVAIGSVHIQEAIAGRPAVSPALGAAIAEVGSRGACLRLLDNPDAGWTATSFERVGERFGQDSETREALLARADLPVAVRHALVKNFASTLKAFVARRRWVSPERAERAATEACEKAALTIAGDSGPQRVAALVEHLRTGGDLTASLLLRAALSGQIVFLTEALGQLAGIDPARVVNIVHKPQGFGFSALYKRAGLPVGAQKAFMAALDGADEFAADPERPWRLLPEAVARVAEVCRRQPQSDLDQLSMLVRRFEMEVAREAVRDHAAIEFSEGLHAAA